MATYTIKQGDNLLEIAKKFGVTTSAILDANAGIYGIGPGVTLRIPTTLKGAPTFPRRGGAPPKAAPYVPPVGTAPGGQTLPPTKKKTPTPAPQIPIPPQYQPPAGTPYTPPTYVPKVGGVQPPVVQPPGVQPPPVSYVPAPFAPQPSPFVPQGIPGYVPPRDLGPYITERPTGPLAIPPDSFQAKAVGFLNRLFGRREEEYVDPATAGMGVYDPSRFYLNRFLQSTPFEPQGYRDLWKAYQLRAAEAQRQGRPSTYTGGAVGQAARARAGIEGTGRELYTAGELAGLNAVGQQGPVSTAPFTGLYQQRYGIPTVGGEAQGYILGNFRDAEGNLIPFDEATKKNVERQKARNKSQLLNLGERPMFISENERIYMGLGKEDMNAIGYEWDEDSQQWIASDVIEGGPQTYGAAAPSGSGYSYPRRGGGVSRTGDGYAYPSYTYPSYTYPQSFVGREGAPYPQSFVGREQRGMTPEQARNRTARFGAVTWRI